MGCHVTDEFYAKWEINWGRGGGRACASVWAEIPESRGFAASRSRAAAPHAPVPIFIYDVARDVVTNQPVSGRWARMGRWARDGAPKIATGTRNAALPALQRLLLTLAATLDILEASRSTTEARRRFAREKTRGESREEARVLI